MLTMSSFPSGDLQLTMSFASLPQWSSALVGILRGASNASEVTEIPTTVTVTALIGLCILCQVGEE